MCCLLILPPRNIFYKVEHSIRNYCSTKFTFIAMLASLLRSNFYQWEPGSHEFISVLTIILCVNSCMSPKSWFSKGASNFWPLLILGTCSVKFSMKSWFQGTSLKFYVHRGQNFTPMIFAWKCWIPSSYWLHRVSSFAFRQSGFFSVSAFY